MARKALTAALAVGVGMALTAGAQAASQSTNIAVIDGPVVTNGGTFPGSTNAAFTGMTFVNLPVADVTGAKLGAGGACGASGCDTVLLNVASSGMGCDTANLSGGAKSALIAFVAAGGKMIIYDSECAFGGPVDYSWLPFALSTDNPGAAGATGTLNITENNAVMSSVSGSSSFIDANLLGTSTDAVGDANVGVTLDPNWCLDASATNVNNVTGPVHIYARHGNGLIMWNGLDVDEMDADTVPDAADPQGNLSKLWLQELKAPFNPTPSNALPCGVAVVGIALTPGTQQLNTGAQASVTANLTDVAGAPRSGIAVTFTVVTGPNAGKTGSGTTGTNGQATFTYTGSGGAGTDEIEACFTENNNSVCSRRVQVVWAGTTPPTPGVIPTLSEWGMIGLVSLMGLAGVVSARRKKDS